MRKILTTAVWLIAGIGCGCAQSFAQEILEKEPGWYTTRELKTEGGSVGSNRLVIKSAVNLSGRIELRTAEQKTISVAYTKQSKAASKAKGIDYIDLISVVLDNSAGQARLEFRSPNPVPWNKETESGIVEAVVTVPRAFAVEIEAAYFDLVARGPLSSLRVPSSLGKLDITDVTELLDVNSANRRISLRKVSGDVSVSTTNAVIEVRQVGNLKGAARFRNEGGDIKIDSASGAINVKNSYGRIDIENFTPLGEASFIRSNSGPISLGLAQMGNGRLVITNQYEDIEVTVPDTLSATLLLAVDDDGTIDVTDLIFKTDLVERDRLNLHTREGIAEINGSIRGKGNIVVRGRKGIE